MISKIISNYEGLNLNVDGLSYVNYFVGKNGSGKSKIFEVIKLLIDKENGVFHKRIRSKLFGSEIIHQLYDLNDSKDFSTIGNHFMANGFAKEKGLKLVHINDLQKIYYPRLSVSNSSGVTYSGNVSGNYHERILMSSDVFKILFGFDKENEVLAQLIKYFRFTREAKEAVIENGKIYFILESALKTANNGELYSNECIYSLSNGTNALLNIYFLSKLKSGSSVLLIDEPEVGLHPEFQKNIPDFLQLLQNKTGMQIFVSTHSPFVIRRALEHKNHQIFHLENGTITQTFNSAKLIEQSGKQYDFVLKDLGFDLTDLFYVKKLIYVEGPVDILFINYWLNLFIKENNLEEFKKGVHYDFVEYGGSLAAHLTMEFSNGIKDSEVLETTELVNLFSLNRQIFFITDNDTNKNAFEKSKNRIKELIKEIENGSVFYRDENIVTIEDYLTVESSFSDNKSNKVNRALVNIKNWQQKIIKLEDFKPELDQLLRRLYEFILK
jgi:predicted ATP-dependent endonuclease of OLD family